MRFVYANQTEHNNMIKLSELVGSNYDVANVEKQTYKDSSSEPTYKIYVENMDQDDLIAKGVIAITFEVSSELFEQLDLNGYDKTTGIEEVTI